MSESEHSSSPVEKSNGNVAEVDADQYAHGLGLAALVASLMLGMFLISLDQTIVGTAIPKITDEFHDLNKVAWYGAA
ncbi:hypothetical protein LTR78_004919 [Recurvomyces mirabilis]|uniref:MFS transporter n=1 Tax=Recurvomyces mirabilis TaxID=574656 RepID=A0AAE1C2F4_9PEZI|nr:hypothetical protein LTR78_004919 [Recurvomyces mirabilis]KAK5158089.1 hypothetical protein LTS14_004012 [Recurvomyces mirabilis]